MNTPKKKMYSYIMVIFSFFLFSIVTVAQNENYDNRKNTTVDSAKQNDQGTTGTETNKSSGIKNNTGIKGTTGTTGTSGTTGTTDTQNKTGISREDPSGYETSMNNNQLVNPKFATSLANDLKKKVKLSEDQTQQVRQVLEDYQSQVNSAILEKNNFAGVVLFTDHESNFANRSNNDPNRERTGVRSGSDDNTGRNNQTSGSFNTGPSGTVSGSTSDGSLRGSGSTGASSTTYGSVSGSTGASGTTGSGTTSGTVSGSGSLGGNTRVERTDVHGQTTPPNTTGSGSLGADTEIHGTTGGNMNPSGTETSGSDVSGSGVSSSGVSGSGSIGFDSRNQENTRAGAMSRNQNTQSSAAMYSDDRMVVLNNADEQADSRIQSILQSDQQEKYLQIKNTWWAKVRQQAVGKNWAAATSRVEDNPFLKDQTGRTHQRNQDVNNTDDERTRDNNLDRNQNNNIDNDSNPDNNEDKK